MLSILGVFANKFVGLFRGESILTEKLFSD